MNPHYAHLLPGAVLDFDRLGSAIRAVAGQPDCSYRMIARNAGVDKRTVDRASRGNVINAQSVLLICLAIDLNPFDLLVSRDGVSREYTSAPLGAAPDRGPGQGVAP
ncbi:MAG: hypothetical protein JJ902_23535 [Roseibium sp.]|nr:hypothetical protein [Roseibium sp.]